MLRTIIRNGFLSKKGAFFDKYSFRFLFFSLIFLLFFSMSCPAEKVGILLPGKEGDWEKAGCYLEEQLDAAGVTAEIICSGNDAGKQKEDLLRLIPEKPDLLLLAAVDPADIEKTAEKAVRTGIPVISCDRPVMSRKIPWCVTFDSRQAGELQGEFLADLLDLDHSRDAVYRVEFICGSRASDQESEPDGQGTDSREEGGQICAGALEFLQPYMDEGLLTSLAADPERMQDLPETQMDLFVLLQVQDQAQRGTDHLPNHRCVRRTGYSQLRESEISEDQDRVEDDVEDRTCQLGYHGIDGKAGRLEQSLKGHLEQHSEGQAQNDAQIGFAIGSDLRVRCLGSEERVHAEDSDQQEDKIREKDQEQACVCCCV